MKEIIEQAQSHITRAYQTLGLFLLKSRINPEDLKAAIVEVQSAEQCLQEIQSRVKK